VGQLSTPYLAYELKTKQLEKNPKQYWTIDAIFNL
jgi:hypothetical protein